VTKIKKRKKTFFYIYEIHYVPMCTANQLLHTLNTRVCNQPLRLAVATNHFTIRFTQLNTSIDS